MSQINQTQLMQQNLQKMIRNENYFSCLFEKSHEQEQPVNPFRKRMFDKNLRRSTVSCGHYNSTSNHNHSKNDESNADNSRISMNAVIKANNSSIKNHQQYTNMQLSQSPLMIEKTQKIILAQSRQSNDPHKQKITQIINNFRLELDYMQEKLHSKVDIIQQKYHNDNDKISGDKQQEINFMLESLQKIVGFMIQNCVNLQDAVMYGEQLDGQRTYNQDQNQYKREIYQIHDDEDKSQQQQQESRENISFGQIQTNSHHHLRNSRHVLTVNKESTKIYGLKQRPNNGQQNSNINIPSTFFINNKLHSSNEKPKTNNYNSNKNKYQKQNTKPFNYQSQHQQSSKPKNQRTPSITNTHNDYHYHSHKQNNSYTNNYSSCPIQNQQQQQPVKSIYETVLQERQMRIKMKKRIV